MVLTSCSYIPLEIPLALGMGAKRAVFHELSPSAETCLPRDLCPYAKAFVREHGREWTVAVAGSCDGMRRVYDALRQFRLARAVCFVDVPRKSEGGADEYYAEVLRAFASEVASTSPAESTGPQEATCDVNGPLFRRRLAAVVRTMDSLRGELARVFGLAAFGRVSATDAMDAVLGVNDALGHSCASGLVRGWHPGSGLGGTGEGPGGEDGWLHEAVSEARAAIRRKIRAAAPGGGARVRVGVSGTCLLEPALIGVLEGVGMSVAFVDSCLGQRSFNFRVLADCGPRGAEADLASEPFSSLARAYLKKPACPRMFVGTARAEYLLGLAGSCGVHGIVYVAPKFCDHAYYDFAELKRGVGERGRLPMLLLEMEFGFAHSGQVITRATAFREMLEGRVGTS
ncbi:MAG: 2-hydroxyacyl-CoA dehydratase family protein [Firmicutes bacterium]|nr:2-hydroxyacyl-CoA dehydratase family protein [Bacillota bacterium]MDH7496668.1 2-hydroxyacyl-CoA dehydratase family protein [Bacillota bacterium]